VLEVWKAQMIISKANTQQRWDVNQLASLVSNLQDQVSTLKKKNELKKACSPGPLARPLGPLIPQSAEPSIATPSPLFLIPSPLLLDLEYAAARMPGPLLSPLQAAE
jgi:hypothetical protein